VRPSAILLDTHALLWWATDAKTLSRTARRLIAHDDTTVVVSAATAWEIATKARLGRLAWPGGESVQAYCTAQRFELLSIAVAHAQRAGSWPQGHGDPFDRLLAAQSAIEGLPLVTNDPQMKRFGIETIW
jgi:PIN domain nuclease of toxin-antitoxin system